MEENITQEIGTLSMQEISFTDFSVSRKETAISSADRKNDIFRSHRKNSFSRVL